MPCWPTTASSTFDEPGVPVTRWDGHSFKPHPATGEAGARRQRAQIPLERYINPCRAEWPPADYVVGNPPFIGASGRCAPHSVTAMSTRCATCGGTCPTRPTSSCSGGNTPPASVAQRPGAALRFHHHQQPEARPLIDAWSTAALESRSRPLSLAYAIPDHPWVDSANGAAVRIAMTVGAPGGVENSGEGCLLTVTAERETGGEGLEVELSERIGLIHADLSIGANVAAAKPLRANGGISSPGFKLHGAGFIVTPEEADQLEVDAPIKPYRNGRDLTDRPRGVKLIDLFGLTAEAVRERYPATFQRVLERVKPERDHNARATYRDNWWIFGEPRKDLRPALANLPRYIATVETAKHRLFQFLDAAIAPDNKLICIALDDAYTLGVLSSRVHVAWALAAGGWMGVGNDPVYNKSKCFDAFPFPVVTPEQQARIRDLAEQIDAHRKRVLAAHDELTLTGLYNVLEKLKIVGAGDTASAAPLTAKGRVIHDKGLVAVLHSLHTDLDAAVLDAYGWSDQPADEILLDRLVALVALNRERTSEEAQGQIRWLRPSLPKPRRATDTAIPARHAARSSQIQNVRHIANHTRPPALADNATRTNGHHRPPARQHRHASRHDGDGRPLHRQSQMEIRPPRNPRHPRSPRPARDRWRVGCGWAKVRRGGKKSALVRR
jgi:hypothetical protein